MIKTFCDRCGEERDIQSTGIHLPYRVCKDNYSVLRLELCASCEKELMSFIFAFPTKNVRLTSDFAKAV